MVGCMTAAGPAGAASQMSIVPRDDLVGKWAYLLNELYVRPERQVAKSLTRLFLQRHLVNPTDHGPR